MEIDAKDVASDSTQATEEVGSNTAPKTAPEDSQPDQLKQSEQPEATANDASAEEQAADKPEKRKKSGIIRLKEETARLSAANAELMASREHLEKKLKELQSPNVSDDDYFERAGEVGVRRAILNSDLEKVQDNLQAVSRQAEEIKQAEYTMIAQRFQESVAKATEAHPDFQRKVEEATFVTPTANAALMPILYQFDDPAPVMYKIASDPVLGAELNAFAAAGDSVGLAVRLGEVKALISKPKQRMITGAPPPTGAVSGGGSTQPNPRDMTQAEYEAWRSKQDKRN